MTLRYSYRLNPAPDQEVNLIEVACGTYQNRDFSAAKSIAKTGELDLIAAVIVARVMPTSQQKKSVKTKVFDSSKLDFGSEKKEVA